LKMPICWLLPSLAKSGVGLAHLVEYSNYG